VHRLGDTVHLTQADSGLTIKGFPGDPTPVVSGALPLDLDWAPLSPGPAPPTPPPKCTLYNNTDVSGGNDVGTPAVATADACLAQCEANCKCGAAVWGQHGTSHTCYLKSQAAIKGGIGGTPGNAAIICTGKPTCGPAAPHTVWRAAVPPDTPPLTTLMTNGVRAIRARYPNANPEVDKFPVGYIESAKAWLPPKDYGPIQYINYSETRPDYVSLFQNYRGGVGGPCSVYDPPFSYWCAQEPQGGGAAQFTLPSGVQYNSADLPRAPYKTVDGAVIWAWRPGHWANWAFQLDAQLPEGGFNWSKGGFQGGRGNSRGAEWFIEGVFEELDTALEWYHEVSANEIYFVTNASDRPTGDFEAPVLKTLFDLRGTQADPIHNITFADLVFTGTAYTFLDPHSPPSGGDWSFQRSGGIFLEGTTGVTITGCRLERLDGNGILLSGYNRYTEISKNHIAYTGDTAIGAWGYTTGAHPAQPKGTGPDGTAGEFPRYTLIKGNFIHHLGIHEKQSSCYFQAKTAETTLVDNICFEIPRAGFNLNDGLGGGNVITSNLLFNTCGESGDHGAINTWDRQAYLTTVATGQPSYRPAVNEIHHNFIVSNGDADGGAVDNDDGSSYYLEHHNFCIYGGAKMGNIDGHAKVYHSNINAYSHVYGTTCFWNWPGWFPERPYEEQYFNNTCIIEDQQNYITGPNACSLTNASSIGIVAHGNTVVVNGTAMVKICGKSIDAQDWLKLGVDPATTVQGGMSSSDIMALGKAMLGF